MKQKTGILPGGTFSRKKYNGLLMAAIMVWIIILIDSCGDLFIAGACLDENAVSAISLVQPIQLVIQFFCMLVAYGTSLMFSRECGAFRHDKAYRLVGQGLIVALVITVLLTASMILVHRPYIEFYGASEEINACADDYYSCVVWYAIILPIYFIIYTLVEIDGDGTIDLIAAIVIAVGNIVISLVLVQSMGIKGLAYGTIIATILGTLVYCVHFFRKTNSIKVRFQFVPGDLVEVIKLSSTSAMTFLYMGILDIIMNKFVIYQFSDAYLPAYAVVNFAVNLGAIFFGCFTAASGFITVSYGERDNAGIKRVMKIATKAAIVLAILIGVIMELIAPFFADMYSITDPHVREASIYAARAVGASSLFTAFYYLYNCYYPAVKKALIGNIMAIVYMLAAPVLLVIPLGMAFGFKGFSWGFALTSAVCIALTAVIICAKYGRKALPLALEDNGVESIAYDLCLNDTSISTLCSRISEDLAQHGIDATIANEVQLIVEESYMAIMEKNKGKKVLSECNLHISDDILRLITRDNGKIFDITDADAKVSSLRSYVLARMMESNSDRTHVTTISFNRNSYTWKLKQATKSDL